MKMFKFAAAFTVTFGMREIIEGSGTCGGPSEDNIVLTEKEGEIDFEIMGCNDAMAVVTLTGGTPVMCTARQLTRPFPCVDSQ
jgi:hypothetical protein